MQKVLPYDPQQFPPESGTVASRGICTYASRCDDADALYMAKQNGLLGSEAWVALCKKHALKRVHGDESRLPDLSPSLSPGTSPVA